MGEAIQTVLREGRKNRELYRVAGWNRTEES
jgi:hypothetical protein